MAGDEKGCVAFVHARLILSADHTALTGEACFHAKTSKESVAKYTSFFEQRVAFKGRIITNIYCEGRFFTK